MSDSAPSYLDCALITGASAGIGSEFITQLAPLCKHLVLVARREDRLRDIKQSLFSTHPELTVTTILSDLSQELQREKFISFLADSKITPTLLINNAGLGDYGEFASSDWAKIRSMIDVNMTALTHLCYAFIPAMKERGCGAIINVSSIASLVPIPDFTVYAATKAYVTSFTEGLRAELREDNISVLTVCPGPVKTEFGQVAARKEEEFHAKGYERLYVDAPTVVFESLSALFNDAARVYPGGKVSAFANVIGHLPNFVVRCFNSLRPRRAATPENTYTDE